MKSYPVKFQTIIREEKGWRLVRLKNPVMGGMYAVYNAKDNRIKTGLCLGAAVEILSTVVRSETALPTTGNTCVLDDTPDPSDEKTWDWSAVYFISLWMLAHDPSFADNDYMDNWDNAKKAYVGFLTDYRPDEYFDGGLPEKLTDYLNETK